MTANEQKALRNSMKDINNLAKAFLMVKKTVEAEYGEAFTNLNDTEQSLFVGQMLADILGI